MQVTAGYHTVYPDAQGDYSIEIEIGTYDVTAALAGYVAEIQPGIVVVEGMTTVGVDFELSLVPTTGFIEGMVVLAGWRRRSVAGGCNRRYGNCEPG